MAAAAAAAAAVPYHCLVPLDAIGLITGRGGAAVRQISRESGAEISVSGDGDTPEAVSDRWVTICGGREQKEAACRLIVERLHEWQEVAEGELGIFVLVVPSAAAGALLGSGRATLEAIAKDTGAEVVVEEELIRGTDDQPVRITGGVDATVAATVRIGDALQAAADTAASPTRGGSNSASAAGGGADDDDEASATPAASAADDFNRPPATADGSGGGRPSSSSALALGLAKSGSTHSGGTASAGCAAAAAGHSSSASAPTSPLALGAVADAPVPPGGWAARGAAAAAVSVATNGAKGTAGAAAAEAVEKGDEEGKEKVLNGVARLVGGAWPVAPQGSLGGIAAGIGASQLRRHSRVSTVGSGPLPPPLRAPSSVPYRCLAPEEAMGLLLGSAAAAAATASGGGRRVEDLLLWTGAEVTVSGDLDTPASLSDRIVTIAGATTSKEAACKHVVQRLFQAQGVEDGGKGIFVMLVPSSCASLIAELHPPPAGEAFDEERDEPEVEVEEETIAGTQDQPVRIFGTLEQIVEVVMSIGAMLQGAAPPTSGGSGGGATSGGGGVAAVGAVASAAAPRRQRGDGTSPAAAVGARRGRPSSEDLSPSSSARVWSSGGGGAGPAAAAAAGDRPPREGRLPQQQQQQQQPRRRTPGASAGASRGPPLEGEASDPPPAPRARGSPSPRAGAAAAAAASAEKLPVATATTRIAVVAKVAAWSIGRAGSSIRELRASTGADVQVAREASAGLPQSLRVVEVSGSLEARLAALEGLLWQAAEIPSGPPEEIALLVPPGAAGFLVGRGGQAIARLRRESGAEIDLVNDLPPGSPQLLAISGELEAMISALCLAAERLDELPAASRGLGVSGSSSGGGSASYRAAMTTPGGLGLGALGGPNLTGSAGLQQSHSEAALLKALIAEADAAEAQLILVLPKDVKQSVATRAQLLAIEARSGSRLELLPGGREGAGGGGRAGGRGISSAASSRGKVSAEPQHAQLVISGSRLGNAMAVLYVQELLAPVLLASGRAASAEPLYAAGGGGGGGAESPAPALGRRSRSGARGATGGGGSARAARPRAR